MGWVEDEATRAEEADEEKARKDEAYRQQSPGLVNELWDYLRQDVEAINRNEYLVKRRLGGEKLSVEDQDHGLRAIKITHPGIYLTVSYRGRYVDIERKILTLPSPDNTQTKSEREMFDIEMDEDDRLFFRNKEGETFGPADASQRVLLPMLRTDSFK